MTTVIEALECAYRCADAGWKGTASAGSTTAALKDLGLIDNEFDTDSWAGVFIYRPNAANASDKLRRVKDQSAYTVGSGTLAVPAARVWTVAPSEGEVYHATGIVPLRPMPGQPYSWERALGEALRRIYYADEVSLGAGDGAGKWEFDVTAAVSTVRQTTDVRNVRLRRVADATPTPDVYAYQDAGKGGRWWEVVQRDNLFILQMHPAPSTDETVLIDVSRPYGGDSEPTADATAINLDLPVLCAATREQLFKRLNSQRGTAGKFTLELATAHADLLEALHRPAPTAKGS